MSNMPSFVIYRHGPNGKQPIIQGWGYKKVVEPAFKALCKLRPTEKLSLEW